MNVFLSEKLHVCKKQINHKGVLTSNQVLYHNKASSIEKTHLAWIRREICTDQTQFTSENRPKTALNQYVFKYGFWCERQQGMDFSLEEALVWIMDLYFIQKWQFEIKCLDVSVSYKHITSLDINWCTGVMCELLVDYCDVFISGLDSHSDGTHSLQRIHWWASDGMLNISKSVPMKQQTVKIFIKL